MNKSGKVYLTTAESIKVGAMTFLIILYFFFLASIISSGINREVHVGKISNEIYVSRLVLSESCIGYNDGIRSHLGIIDIEKLTSERLDICLKNDRFAAKLNITYNSNSIVAYNNKVSYLVNSKLCFSNRYKCGTLSPKKFIAVHDKGTVYPGVLESGVVFDET